MVLPIYFYEQKQKDKSKRYRYFENITIIEPLYGKAQKLRTFLIILHIFSFLNSVVLFDHRNKHSHQSGIGLHHDHSTHGLINHITVFDLKLIYQSIINVFLIMMEFIHLVYETRIQNERRQISKG